MVNEKTKTERKRIKLRSYLYLNKEKGAELLKAQQKEADSYNKNLNIRGLI